MSMNKWNVYSTILNYLEGEIEALETNIEVLEVGIETLEHDEFFSHVLVSTAGYVFLVAYTACLTHISFSIYTMYISSLI